MSQRDNLTPAKAWAHGVLDDVRAGLDAHSDTLFVQHCVRWVSLSKPGSR